MYSERKELELPPISWGQASTDDTGVADGSNKPLHHLHSEEHRNVGACGSPWSIGSPCSSGDRGTPTVLGGTEASIGALTPPSIINYDHPKRRRASSKDSLLLPKRLRHASRATITNYPCTPCGVDQPSRYQSPCCEPIGRSCAAPYDASGLCLSSSSPSRDTTGTPHVSGHLCHDTHNMSVALPPPPPPALSGFDQCSSPSIQKPAVPLCRQRRQRPTSSSSVAFTRTFLVSPAHRSPFSLLPSLCEPSEQQLGQVLRLWLENQPVGILIAEYLKPSEIRCLIHVLELMQYPVS